MTRKIDYRKRWYAVRSVNTVGEGHDGDPKYKLCRFFNDDVELDKDDVELYNTAFSSNEHHLTNWNEDWLCSNKVLCSIKARLAEKKTGLKFEVIRVDDKETSEKDKAKWRHYHAFR